MFNQNKMLTELLDLCSNWSEYSYSNNTDIKSYYLTEALLQIKAKEEKGFYSNLIKKALKTEEGTQMYTLSLMKAFLKEKEADAALNVYKSEIKT